MSIDRIRLFLGMVEKKYQLYKVLLAICSILYLAFLVYAVFFARRRRHLDERFLNLIPIRNTIYQYQVLKVNTALTFNFYTNLFGNILLFMPIPFILIYFFRFKKLFSILLTGFAISFAIELLQYLFDVGVADVDDLLLNTLGTLLGYYCYTAFRKILPSL